MMHANIDTYRFVAAPFHVDFMQKLSMGVLGKHLLNCADSYASDRGFDVAVQHGEHYTWVLSRLAVEVVRRPEQYADIEIDTWVNEFNRLTTTRNFRMHASDELYAEGVSQWCVIDMESRSAVDLNIFKDIYDKALVDEASPIAAPVRLRGIVPEKSMSRPVVYSDIDFNRHVNTLRYVALIFDTLPLDVIENGDELRIDLHFLAEAVYGEVMQVGSIVEGNVWQFEITSDSGKTLCRARIEFR